MKSLLKGDRHITGRERIMSALKGEKTDRLPIWLKEGLDYTNKIPGSDDQRKERMI